MFLKKCQYSIIDYKMNTIATPKNDVLKLVFQKFVVQCTIKPCEAIYLIITVHKICSLKQKAAPRHLSNVVGDAN